jgi:hypothetical protein
MATQEQHWESVVVAAGQGFPYGSCLIELCARVDALEAKLASPPCILVPSISDEQLESLKQPGRIEVLEPGDQMVAPAPTDGLVRMVAKRLANEISERMYEVNMDFGEENHALAAAALRAAADQVVPHEEVPHEDVPPHEMERLRQRQRTRDDLLAIASELEGRQP